jgi:hypothetical protein
LINSRNRSCFSGLCAQIPNPLFSVVGEPFSASFASISAAANSAADGSSGETAASTFPFILAREAGNLGDLLALLFVIFFMRKGGDIL